MAEFRLSLAEEQQERRKGCTRTGSEGNRFPVLHHYIFPYTHYDTRQTAFGRCIYLVIAQVYLNTVVAGRRDES